MVAIAPIIRHWLGLAVNTAQRHPRRVGAAVLSVLAGFAVTAFGIAPMAPDAAQLPRSWVSQAITVQGLADQAEALASHELALTRSDITRSTDSADTLLRRLGIQDAAAAQFLRTDREARRLLQGRGGKMVQAQARADGGLVELVGRFGAPADAAGNPQFTRLTLRQIQGRWQSRVETAALVAQVRLGSGSIRSSLFAATDEARLSDSIASQMVDIFSADVDFHRQLRRGDTFSVVYEALSADDQPITWNEGTGRVLAAEFNNNGKRYQATWFRDGAGKGSYFGLDGQSKRRAFLASPLEFSRVTSGFAMRFHPIFQSWRAHLGVDYSAPRGTTVRAVGDGIVEQAGWQNGYGNVVSIKHANEASTVYAHLSRVDVRPGARVDQGQSLGAVGATGWATGPHLHFEFRIKGQHQDPLQMARSAETVALDSASLLQFETQGANLRAKLAMAETLVGYRGDGE